MADKKVEKKSETKKEAVTAANIYLDKEKDKMVQRTLIIFKPDAVQRGIVGEILSRFERVGLKIVGAKMVNPDKDQYYVSLGEFEGHPILKVEAEGISKMISRRGQKTFDVTLKFMTSGPVIAMVLEGVEAVPQVRKMVGSTEPMAADMGTIRGDYAHISFGYADAHDEAVPNLIHASGNPEEAEAEVSYWFKPEEIQTYKTLAEKYTR